MTEKYNPQVVRLDVNILDPNLALAELYDQPQYIPSP